MTTERDTQHLMDKYGVAWWKFDEESGNTIVDSKGNFNGTAYNVTRVAGISGNALSFNGSSSFVEFSNIVIPLGKKSIRFKIKISTSHNSTAVIMSNANGGAEFGTFVMLNSNGNLRWLLARGNTSSRICDLYTNKNIKDNQWHDILMTWTGDLTQNGVKIYVDDMKTPDVVGTANFTETTTSSYNLQIGRRIAGTEFILNGQLDEIEIYNKALTYEDLYPNKTLIQSDDNIHYSYDNDIWQPIAENPTQQDYKQYGMYDDDLQTLTKADLLTLPNLVSNKPKVRTFKYN